LEWNLGFFGFFSVLGATANFLSVHCITSRWEQAMKSLVVYYSRTGNAKFVAETIAATVGADLEEIVDLADRSGSKGFLLAGKDATKGNTTKIAETQKHPQDYDLIVMGQPVWAFAPTPAIRTYIKQNDLSGKKVALFFTQGWSRPQAIEKTKALMPNCEFVGVLSLVEPLSSKEESEQKIIDWCSILPH
jgi:flavodoxin